MTSEVAATCCFVIFTSVLFMKPVTSLRMLNTGLVIVSDQDDMVDLQCQFEEQVEDQFNLFDNPVHWRKTQLDEQTQMNMMVNLLEPFVEHQRRMHVSFRSRPPNYTMSLVIAHASVQDTANYTCVVNGPHNIVLASVTHQLYVRAPVDVVQLVVQQSGRRVVASTPVAAFYHTGSPSPASATSVTSSVGQIVVDEGSMLPVECLSFGGCPTPSMSLRLGRRDVTQMFLTSSNATLTGSQRAMRTIRRTVHATYASADQSQKQQPPSGSSLVVSANDDGLTFYCEATVSGVGPVTVSARLSVLYAPVITCDDVMASVGDTNVKIQCKVKAKPEVTSLYWTLDNNDTSLNNIDHSLSSIKQHWTTVVRDAGTADGSLESQLVVGHVTADSFRTFTVVAENERATTLHNVRLRRRDGSVDRQRNKYSTTGNGRRDSQGPGSLQGSLYRHALLPGNSCTGDRASVVLLPALLTSLMFECFRRLTYRF